MSQYTTGELAKRCGVTVRTVQYYDTRGILVPSALTEGGRRLYSEEDLNRMKIICFLRELGLSIDAIAKLLAEDNPGSVITLLLAQQEQALDEEIREREDKRRKLEEVQRALKSVENVSVESIGDIVHIMSDKKKLKKVYATLLLGGLPLTALEVAGIILWIVTGAWWLLAVWAVLAIPGGILLLRYYYRHVAYICPQCHTAFKPTFKEMFFAPHTPRTRKLTCTHCGHKGYCVEIADE